MQGLLERVGSFTLHIFEKVGVLSLLFLETLRQMPKIQRKLTIAQMAQFPANCQSDPVVCRHGHDPADCRYPAALWGPVYIGRHYVRGHGP